MMKVPTIEDLRGLGLFNQAGSINSNLFRKGKNLFLGTDFEEWHDSLSGVSLREAIYRIRTNLAESPVCSYCGVKKVSFLSPSKGYRKYCSSRCSRSAEETQTKQKGTCEEKYGKKHYSQTNEFREKINLKKKGGAYSQVNERGRITKKERWGSETFNNREQAKATSLKVWGVENPAQASEVREKMRKTSQERYGRDIAGYGVPQISEKARNTLLDRYGVSCALQNKKLAEVASRNREATMLRRYKSIFGRLKTQYEYDEKIFDSSYELIYFLFLTDHQRSFIFKPSSLEYSYDGGSHKYFPDFQVDGIYIEIKGNHLISKAGDLVLDPRITHTEKKVAMLKEKQNCMLKNNVRILTKNSPELIEAFDHYKACYTKDYIDQFRRGRCQR